MYSRVFIFLNSIRMGYCIIVPLFTIRRFGYVEFKMVFTIVQHTLFFILDSSFERALRLRLDSLQALVCQM